MAPFWDLIFKRQVRWYSWVAFGLSFMALIMLFSEKGGYVLTVLALLNIASYLSGYFFRLQFMTRKVKTNNQKTSYKFFIEEMLVAMFILLLVPVIFALIGSDTIMQELRIGFTTFLWSNLAIPALIICSSLLAGVAASFILGFIFDASFVSTMQLASAGVLIASILFLSYSVFSKKEQAALAFVPTRNYVFVCSGNTSRSPMAHSICINSMTKMLRRRGIDFENANIKVSSK